MIGDASDDRIDLAEIIRLELQPHRHGQDGRVTLAGPPVPLDGDRIQTLALALHELATNAVKHGALRGQGGRLEVGWSVTPEGRLLILDWRESGVTMPPDTYRRGFGRKLIERALTFTLQAKTELIFGVDGVSCRIELPLQPAATEPPDLEAA